MASLNSLGMASFSQILKTSSGIPSMPGAFPEQIWAIAFLSSSMVGGMSSSSMVLHGGIMSKAGGSTVESLLRKLSKCSCHLSFIAFLSFGRVEPSNERRGEALDLVVPFLYSGFLCNVGVQQPFPTTRYPAKFVVKTKSDSAYA